MKTYLYRASNLKSTITFQASVSWRSQFLVPAKNHRFLQFIPNNNNNNKKIIIIFINFFRLFFSEYTEANATSLIPLDTILPEKCAFIIGFNCTVWTKMRSLLALYLMVRYLNSTTPAYIRKVRGHQKITETKDA